MTSLRTRLLKALSVEITGDPTPNELCIALLGLQNKRRPIDLALADVVEAMEIIAMPIPESIHTSELEIEQTKAAQLVLAKLDEALMEMEK